MLPEQDIVSLVIRSMITENHDEVNCSTEELLRDYREQDEHSNKQRS